jgi:hypothetical protein
MPWEIVQDASVLHVRLTPPLADDWEAIFEEIRGRLAPPRPLAIYLPAKINDGTKTDAEMLASLWEALQASGVPIMRERSG